MMIIKSDLLKRKNQLELLNTHRCVYIRVHIKQIEPGTVLLSQDELNQLVNECDICK